jgi:hypothetical protein
MLAGTSPSIAAMPSGGYEIAYQTSDGVLGTVSPTGHVDGLGLGMAPGTSPSIAAQPSGKWEIAFQANTGQLWVRDSDNGGGPVGGQPGHLMRAGTSPSTAALRSGGYEIVYQTSDGLLGGVSATGDVSSLGLAVWPASSPSMAPVTCGGFQVAFEANTANLWTRYPDCGAQDLRLGMPTT